LVLGNSFSRARTNPRSRERPAWLLRMMDHWFVSAALFPS